MGKIISQMMVSADGCHEGLNREIDWHNVDEEYNEYAAALLQSATGIVFGRVTYERMASYWPTAASSNDIHNTIIAGQMNRLPKFVFTKTLERAEWEFAEVVNGDLAKEIARLKSQFANNLLVLGSAALVSSLSKLNLIDEYQIIVNPVVLGAGRPFVQELNDKMNLKLTQTHAFRSGNVLLCYQPQL
ncbi:dihydrofolate reductase [Paenibacillaceae bacterium]|nr:dihydrofolate reductase [Paenibacillaceae bacterium]